MVPPNANLATLSGNRSLRSRLGNARVRAAAVRSCEKIEFEPPMDTDNFIGFLIGVDPRSPAFTGGYIFSQFLGERLPAHVTVIAN